MSSGIDGQQNESLRPARDNSLQQKSQSRGKTCVPLLDSAAGALYTCFLHSQAGAGAFAGFAQSEDSREAQVAGDFPAAEGVEGLGGGN